MAKLLREEEQKAAEDLKAVTVGLFSTVLKLLLQFYFLSSLCIVQRMIVDNKLLSRNSNIRCGGLMHCFKALLENSGKNVI